jgi:membrane-associated phospholipid phosphatase
LLDVCDWTYLNAHLFVTVGTLAFVYVRRNDSFYFVRNAFMVAMGIALVGYALYPTAPPRLLPEWGFTDSVAQFTGVAAEKAGILINAYAAVPSMHVCFALLIGVTMSRLVAGRAARAVWLAYPVYVTFVVVVTGNHYFTDVALGGLTAALSALLARQLLARARPDVWAFGGAPA